MMSKWRLVDQLQGASQLAIEVTHNVTNLVEEMHHTIAGGPQLLGRPLATITKVLTAPAYGAIHGVTSIVGTSVNLVLSRCETLLAQPGFIGGPLLAALNGVLGDYLAETGNPLAIEMQFIFANQPLELSSAALAAQFPTGQRLLILLHGSSLDVGSWQTTQHNHGTSLAEDLGLIPIYLRYNSGLHISQNGRAFAEKLQQLIDLWPRPVESLVFLGHSMGGLVARSACHVATEKGLTWRKQLKVLLTIGSPHHGAPLERGGNWVDRLLESNRYSAPLGKLGRVRSAGVTDLRYGNVLDSHWGNRDRFAFAADSRSAVPLPKGVACFAIAASRNKKLSASPIGDGLVPVASGLGRHKNPDFDLGFPRSHQWIAAGTSHLGLLGSKAVYAQILQWLKPTADSKSDAVSTFGSEEKWSSPP